MSENSDFYADPANQEPAAGPPVRRRAKSLTTHVPVRFDPETIASVRRLAALDHMTVSTWIRRLVTREVERQLPPRTGSGQAPLWEPSTPSASETKPEQALETVLRSA